MTLPKRREPREKVQHPAKSTKEESVADIIVFLITKYSVSAKSIKPRMYDM